MLLIITFITLLTFIIWYFEPRIFLVLFQNMFYRVNNSEGFIKEIEEYFPSHSEIIKNIEIINAELENLIACHSEIPKAHEVDKLNREISFNNEPGWRTFYIKVYGQWLDENRKLFPKTFDIFKNMNNVITIMFSVMEPGNVIPPHQGKLPGFLRYQLPLIVPNTGKCEITVNKQTSQYKKGEALLFDDNVTHSVVNLSNEFRVVLFLDVRKKSNNIIKLLDVLMMKFVMSSPKLKRAGVNLKKLTK